MKSLNQIIAELETFANVHYQIHTFGHGDPWEIAPNSSEIVYPILWLVPTGATTGVNEVTTNFTVLCMDLVRSGEENETEVLSDTLQIILDVVSYYRQQHDQTYIVEFGSQIQPFTERDPDMLAGHSITVSIRQPFKYDECAIPFSGAPTPLVPTCAAATIQNAASNPTYQASIASGGNLVLPQVKVLDSDGVTPILANYIPNTDGFVATCSAPTCADATVQLNGTTVGTIASGGSDSFTVNLDGSPSGVWDGTAWQVTSAPCDDATIELNGVEMTTIPSGDTENILVLQSNDMTQVGSKQGTHWRIDDSAISINGSPVADVMAEDALDIDVTQGGSPVGSWNGSAWVVPACAVPNSISLSVSDSNPDLGDSVTITATPSAGYVPTSYTFTIPRINGETYSVTQTGAGANVYVWTAEGNGTVTINVCSTDGTDTAANMIDVDVVFPFVYDDYAGMSTSWGLFKANSAYSGNWAQFQRQSDGAYLEVGWVNGCVADLQSLVAWAGMSRARLTILYDSTGNGNHAYQNIQSVQFRAVEANIKIGNDNLLWAENNSRMLVQSGGTTPPNASSYVDVYTSVDISYDGGFSAFWTIMQRSVNSQFMLFGQLSSTSTAINNSFGSPTYYRNGSLSGWSTRGDVYTALYRTGRNQITIIGGNTSSSDWLTSTIGGSQDFGRYWEGGMGMYWFWVASTASVRTEIEEKYNRLCALNIR